MNVIPFFVDPPRAGLDPDTVKLVQNYDRILYISCNPHTLCDNLVELSKTHRIEKAALFDQFPTLTTWKAAYGSFASRNSADF